MPVVSLPPMRLSRSVRLLKRAFDIVAVRRRACSCSRRCWPASRSRSSSTARGPVFFRQERHGRGGRDVPDRQVPHDGRRTPRRSASTLAHLNEMDGRAALQDQATTRASRASAALPAPLQHRRAAAALERADGRDEPRRARGPFVVHESDQITGWAGRRLDIDARHHRPLAGARAQRHPLRGDGQARLPLRDQLVALVGPQDPVSRRSRSSSARGGPTDERLRDPGVQRGGERAAPARRPRGASRAVGAAAA